VAAAPLMCRSASAASLHRQLKTHSCGQEEPLALSRDGAQCMKGFEATLKSPCVSCSAAIQMIEGYEGMPKSQTSTNLGPLCAFRPSGGGGGGGEGLSNKDFSAELFSGPISNFGGEAGGAYVLGRATAPGVAGFRFRV